MNALNAVVVKNEDARTTLAHAVERATGRGNGGTYIDEALQESTRATVRELNVRPPPLIVNGRHVFDVPELQRVLVPETLYNLADATFFIEPLDRGRRARFVLLRSQHEQYAPVTEVASGRDAHGWPIAANFERTSPLQFAALQAEGTWFAAAGARVYLRAKLPNASLTPTGDDGNVFERMPSPPEHLCSADSIDEFEKTKKTIEAKALTATATPTTTPTSSPPSTGASSPVLVSGASSPKASSPIPIEAWWSASFPTPRVVARKEDAALPPAGTALVQTARLREATARAVQRSLAVETESVRPDAPWWIERAFVARDWEVDASMGVLMDWLRRTGLHYVPSTSEVVDGGSSVGPAAIVAARGTGMATPVEVHAPAWPPRFLVPIRRREGVQYAPLPAAFRSVSDARARVPPDPRKGGVWAELALWPSEPWRYHQESRPMRAAANALEQMASVTKRPAAAGDPLLFCENWDDFAGGRLPADAVQALEPTVHGLRRAIGLRMC